MKSWAQQLAGTVLVVVFALAVGGFVTILRAQQAGLAATMAVAHIRAVSPPDGASNVPIDGEIRVDYVSQPAHDPVIKLEPPVAVTLDNPHWDGTTFVIDYHGLRDNSLYHVELDQDDWTGTGEHKQVKVRWSFRTATPAVATPTPVASSATPTVSPAPTPSSPPPTISDLVWYSGNNSSALNGIDWNGKQVKTTKWVGQVQSPNGQRIYNEMTPSTWVYDADGNRIGSIAGYAPQMWADDSQQFCGITYNTASAPQSLVTMPLDGSVHTVAPVSLQDPAGKPVQETLLAACSDLAGRAIVYGKSNGFIWTMAMISLTDGSVIYRMKYPNPPTHFAASHDGRYVAEQIGGSGSTLIRELPSGNVVGEVTGIVVSGFSWDGSLVAGGIQGNTGLSGAEVIRWQTRQVVWNRCGCPSPFDVKVIAQPGGTKVAIGASNQNVTGTLTIVDATGSAQTIPVGNQSVFFLF